MPMRPARACRNRSIGCPNKTEATSGWCATCGPKVEQQRRTAETWRWVYQDPRWRPLRALALREAQYLCQCDECRGCRRCGMTPMTDADRIALTCWACAALLRAEPANTVDHRVPHRGDAALAFDRDNLMAMSQAHHSAKTAKEVGLGR